MRGLVSLAALRGSDPQDCGDFHDWLLASGGVDAPQTKLQLVVQGRVDDAVLISGMRAEILDARAPARASCRDKPVLCNPRRR